MSITSAVPGVGVWIWLGETCQRLTHHTAKSCASTPVIDAALMTTQHTTHSHAHNRHKQCWTAQHCLRSARTATPLHFVSHHIKWRG